MKTSKLVSEFLQEGPGSGLSSAAIKWYKCLLLHFCATYKDLPLDDHPIKVFLGNKTWSDENRHAHFRALRAFYNWSFRNHDLARDPRARQLLTLGIPIDQVRNLLNPIHQVTMRLPRHKVPYSLTATELAWVLAEALPPRDRALVCLLADTGIRIGEALGLCFGDIQDEYITVYGKTGERQVPLSPETCDQLLQLGSRGRVFKTSKGPMTISGAYKIIRNSFQRAGIKARKWGPHVLRHTFGRLYIMDGGDLSSLQRIMGHANISTTKIYAELDLRDITIQHGRHTPLRAAQKSAQGLMFMDHRPELRPEIRN